ncbi:dihydroxyacetone kinase phosphoryl donor subunit DhaM [Nocardia carnea]|uniref:dihydroxyacetone kinase phosphoryl donor subunit DhaM n=1 Tax=Nocardia carnea TaxID=37328 RepID=UPI0024556559|nr:dihydroxyacetone kinase phosphoryl donor subunit DhaM [Nocardia carnea]
MTKSVGIVLVSHSAELAAGLKVMLAQIGSDSVPVAAAGGTTEGEVGTSYELVTEAIARADHGAGVVILPDLGSSVLTARTALQDRPRADISVIDAPFVEGAVAAVVTAASGGDLDAVIAATQEARHVPKF